MKDISGGIPVTSYVKNLDKAVEYVRHDKEWEERFMKLDLRDREHERLGECAAKVSMIKKFRYILAENDLSKMVDDDKKMLNRIIYFIDNNPDMDNYDIAEEILNDED